METEEEKNAIDKCDTVIASCITIEHLAHARVYFELMTEKYKNNLRLSILSNELTKKEKELNFYN